MENVHLILLFDKIDPKKFKLTLFQYSSFFKKCFDEIWNGWRVNFYNFWIDINGYA